MDFKESGTLILTSVLVLEDLVADQNSDWQFEFGSLGFARWTRALGLRQSGTSTLARHHLHQG